jgi:8-oxo-dGTP pyrophosphatase MutT (NUDIX family)
MPKAETVWMEGAAPRFRYFATEPSWDLGPSGTLRTGMTQEYRIALRGSDGAIHTILDKPSLPREVTDADEFRFETLLREALERTGISPDAVQRQIDRLSFGTTFPAFNQMMEGPDGTTLVQRIDALENIERLDLREEQSRRIGSSTWDVFGADGRFLGPIELPARFTPMVWRSDAVYGRWLDDQDVAHVRKLSLARGAGIPGESCR